MSTRESSSSLDQAERLDAVERPVEKWPDENLSFEIESLIAEQEGISFRVRAVEEKMKKTSGEDTAHILERLATLEAALNAASTTAPGTTTVTPTTSHTIAATATDATATATTATTTPTATTADVSVLEARLGSLEAITTAQLQRLEARVASLHASSAPTTSNNTTTSSSSTSATTSSSGSGGGAALEERLPSSEAPLGARLVAATADIAKLEERFNNVATTATADTARLEERLENVATATTVQLERLEERLLAASSESVGTLEEKLECLPALEARLDALERGLSGASILEERLDGVVATLQERLLQLEEKCSAADGDGATPACVAALAERLGVIEATAIAHGERLRSATVATEATAASGSTLEVRVGAVLASTTAQAELSAATSARIAALEEKLESIEASRGSEERRSALETRSPTSHDLSHSSCSDTVGDGEEGVARELGATKALVSDQAEQIRVLQESNRQLLASHEKMSEQLRNVLEKFDDAKPLTATRSASVMETGSNDDYGDSDDDEDYGRPSSLSTTSTGSSLDLGFERRASSTSSVGGKNNRISSKFSNGEVTRFQTKKTNKFGKAQSRVIELNLAERALKSLGINGECKKMHLLQDIRMLERNKKDSLKCTVIFQGMQAPYQLQFPTTEQRESFCHAILAAISDSTSQPNMPFGQYDISVWTGTWNIGKLKPPSVLSAWLQSAARHDIYCVGVQECRYDVGQGGVDVGFSGSQDHFANIIQTHLGPDYVQLSRQSLWEILILVFVRKDHLNAISSVERASKATGFAKVCGNKGGVAVSFTFHETSLCFVCSHLAAQPENLELRNENFHEIVKFLHLGAPDFDITNQFHHIFWVGDLNYRNDYEFNEAVAKASSEDFLDLLEYDQLTKEMKHARTFFGFTEGKLTFPPTYKYNTGSRVYMNKNDQAPSWCDRVLWRSLPRLCVTQTKYECVQNVMTSDHSPVFSEFTVPIERPFIPSSESDDVELVMRNLRVDLETNRETEAVVDIAQSLYVQISAPFLEKRPSTSEAAYSLHVSWPSTAMPRMKPFISHSEYLLKSHLHLLVFAKTQKSRCCLGQGSVFVGDAASASEEKPQRLQVQLTTSGMPAGVLQFDLHLTWSETKP